MARFGNGDDRVTLANALEFGGVGNDKKDQKIMIQMIDKLSDKEARIALRNVERERTDESVNEGPSTEEKRIAMLAVRKQAKYRQVSLEQAIQDQINALEELKRDAKRGKIK